MSEVTVSPIGHAILRALAETPDRPLTPGTIGFRLPAELKPRERTVKHRGGAHGRRQTAGSMIGPALRALERRGLIREGSTDWEHVVWRLTPDGREFLAKNP